jgi:VWFA-related protein
VRVDVSVSRSGRFLGGLTADQFTVADNGVRQQVQAVVAEMVPVTVILALDISASMEGVKLHDLIEASRALIQAFRSDDRATVVTFSHHISAKAPLTSDKQQLYAVLDTLEAAGGTALRDALFAALQVRRNDVESRPVVLLFSDGADTASWLTETEVLASVRRGGVTVHGVEIATAADTAAGHGRFLDEVTTASGGRWWTATASGALKTVFADVLNEMRARYVLSYYPTDRRAGWHYVSVSVRGAQTRTRAGYFVP